MEVMDEDPVIVSEKVNLLLGFFSSVPESVIRDVMYRPDINGSVELASEALSTLMEFGEPDDNLMNYHYKSREEDLEQTNYKTCSEDWGQGKYKGSEEDWGQGEPESSKTDWEQDNAQTRPGILSELSSGARKNEREQSNMFSTQAEKPSLVEQRTSFQSKLDVIEPLQSTNSLRSSEKERKTEESLSNLVRNERSVIAEELCVKAKDTTASTSRQSDSDEDEDIEKYFESNYGQNEGTHVEKAERNLSGSSIPSRRPEPAHEIPKDEFSLNARATVEAVSSRKVNQSRDRQPAGSQSQDDRDSVKILGEATEVKTETLLRKCGQVSAQEVNKTEANYDKNCQEPDEKTKHVLPPKPTLPPKISENKPEQFPRMNIPEPKSESYPGVKHVAKETEELSNKPAPKRRNRVQQERKAAEIASRERNDQKPGDVSNEGQMSSLACTWRKQSDVKSTNSYESRRLLVLGLSEKTTSHALSNDMELMTGGDVMEVTLGQGKPAVMQYISESPDFKFLWPIFIEEMSKAVSTKWLRLARLLDIPESTVAEIERNSIIYPDLRARAKRIIELFLNQHRAGEFSASAELVNCVSEIRVKLPDDFVRYYSGANLEPGMLSGEMTSYQNPFLSSTHSAGTSMLDGSPEFLQINAAKEDVVLDLTPLSPREIERLSREIPATWRQLAGLLELPPDDVKNVERNSQYFDETDKAVKVLQLYIDAPSFNRSELGDFLEELGHLGLKEKIVNGTLGQRHYTQS